MKKVSKLKDNEIRDDEKYFLKFFEQKKLQKKKPSTKPKKNLDFDGELEDFADDVVEEKMNELNKDQDIDDFDDFDEFLQGELEDEDLSEDEEEIGFENKDLEDLVDEEIDHENQEEAIKGRFEKKIKKQNKNQKSQKKNEKGIKKKKKKN